MHFHETLELFNVNLFGLKIPVFKLFNDIRRETASAFI